MQQIICDCCKDSNNDASQYSLKGQDFDLCDECIILFFKYCLKADVVLPKLTDISELLFNFLCTEHIHLMKIVEDE